MRVQWVRCTGSLNKLWRNKTELIFLIVFLITLIIILFVNSNFFGVAYYNESELLGPFSKYPLIVTIQFSLPLVFMLTFLKHRRASLRLLLIPFILLIIVKYLNSAFKKKSFNKIFAFEVLEHLPSVYKILGEIRNVLRKEGSLITLQSYYSDVYAVLRHELNSPCA